MHRSIVGRDRLRGRVDGLEESKREEKAYL